jgi:hypothetical protein
MDGPVVTAARKALEAENVNLILPYVPESGAAERNMSGRRLFTPACI